MSTVSSALVGLSRLQGVLEAKLLAVPQPPGTEVYPFTPGRRPGQVPAIELAIESDEAAPDWGHTARRCVVTASVQVSEFAGALAGVENPDPSQDQLSRFLRRAALDYEAFNAAGLWGIDLSGPHQGTDPDSGAALYRHAFTFYYDPATQ